MNNVHLNKWLWACGFFKTAVLAKQAIETSILLNANIAQANVNLKLGDRIIIIHHRAERAQEIEVTGLASRRYNQENSKNLYQILRVIPYPKALQLWKNCALAANLVVDFA